jgi:hypothetical protein
MGPLDAIADRARKDPFFLGWLLDRYAAAEGLDDAGLAERLGCAALAGLMLCRAPRRSPHFRADVERIAEVFGIDASRLAEALRRANVVILLEEAPEAAEDAPTLMAARDLDEEEGRP